MTLHPVPYDADDFDLLDDEQPDDGNRPAKASTADKLVRIARDRYTFHSSAEGDYFALPSDGPPVPVMLRGTSSSLRGTLAGAYLTDYDKAPTAQALTDALLVCEGWAMQGEPVPLYQRVARTRNGIVLDLGMAGDARCVIVTPDGWHVAEQPPAGVLFRRTKLTSSLPQPTHDGDVRELRHYLHVDDDGWALLLGWIVACLFPQIPHPILALSGEQGAAKSTTARMVLGITDPSPAPLRRAPRDDEEWMHYCRTSHALAVDNISSIPPWLSDALCRASTGDGIVRRMLYTDSDVIVFAFRRCVILTGITISAVQGDLIDRLVNVELSRIDEAHRRLDSELSDEYEAARPAILGGLMGLVSHVLRHLPDVHLPGYPRMADYAAVLAAVDVATDTGCLDAYTRMYANAFEDACESNLVAHAVVTFMDGRESWTGTATGLHEMISPTMPPKGWPRTAHHFSNDVFRAQTILRAAGITLDRTRTHGGTRYLTLTRTGES